MVETFTQNEMIKALYHELNSEAMFDLEIKLENNEEIEHRFDDLNVLKVELNKLIEQPSDATVNSILNYSLNFKK